MTHQKPHGIFGLVINYSWASCYTLWEEGRPCLHRARVPTSKWKGTKDVTLPCWPPPGFCFSKYHTTFQNKGICLLKISTISIHEKESGEIKEQGKHAKQDTLGKFWTFHNFMNRLWSLNLGKLRTTMWDLHLLLVHPTFISTFRKGAEVLSSLTLPETCGRRGGIAGIRILPSELVASRKHS